MTNPDQSDFTVPALESLCGWTVRRYFPPPGWTHDDMMQEARIGAWKAIRDFQPDAGSSFKSFARLCIERQVITAIKTGTRQKHGRLNEAVSFDAPVGDDGTMGDLVLASPAADPERRLIDKERLREALELLRMDVTTLERKVFLAVEVDGLSYDVVSDALGIDKKAVDNALQRVRKKLDQGAADPQCDVCGKVLEWGRRCESCDDEIEFARRFLAA